ncbi:virion structural protein [Serratia phage BF]|uniref:Structural protein n=1 Tax=Serratia phage BF TaxID=1962671 RepID=A0A1S6UAJ6_9CAUD|nr:virion structural protein [Serratia phage BF]AQW88731.1 structural protein [Serratia phage BF]QXO11900.1 hypothetical protein pEaSNUABM44_00204 [Erwinia phage pEa_SNUABM_44]
MNKLQKFLIDLTPEYSYRVKFACEPSSEELHKVVSRLTDRYDAFEVGPLKKTIFQDRPLDFFNLDCGEIWMFDFKCNRGVQPQVLLFEIGSLLKWPETLIHIRNNMEPSQEEMANSEDDIDFDEYEPRLLDPDYTEVPEVNAEELGGQGRADTAVKDAIENYKKDRTPYAEYMSAGFGKKE